ncbi:MAG TPA: acyl-ACP thioesterase domain-containing protein [Acidimicrobiales bacterium]|nr:acyl-ACP thioesterase domain-containing protein [Acidimicrobiales bacterium]
MTSGAPHLVPPGGGRRFEATRRVRVGDVLPSGGARLDALARYLQDVATDDGVDAGLDPGLGWVTRKTVLDIRRRPTTGQWLHLTTWGSGTGSRWAERRTTIAVEGTVVVEAAALWVCIDLATLRPAKLPDRFWRVYGEAVGDRTVPSRLGHPDPAPELLGRARRWPLRLTDFDMFDHVNNAATWTPIEDELLRVSEPAAIRWVELEYRVPIDHGAAVGLVSQLDGSTARVWLVREGTIFASAVAGVGAGLRA